MRAEDRDDGASLWAHLMLGAVAVISGAAQTLREQRHQLDDRASDELLAIVGRRAEYLTTSLRAMAGGGVPDGLAVLTQLPVGQAGVPAGRAQRSEMLMRGPLEATLGTACSQRA